MSIPVDSSYFSTVAQVIPALLLAAAIEHRSLSPDPDVDSRLRVLDRVVLATFVVLAFVGEVAAIDALYSGVGDTMRAFTLTGVLAALVLVVMPMVLRAVGSIFDNVPGVRRYLLHHVLPAVLLVVVAGVLIEDLLT